MLEKEYLQMLEGKKLVLDPDALARRHGAGKTCQPHWHGWKATPSPTGFAAAGGTGDCDGVTNFWK
jgi:hypothetical protein